MLKPIYRCLWCMAVGLFLLFSPALLAQGVGGPGLVATDEPSGFAGSTGWVIDDLMRPHQQAQVGMTSVNSEGAANGIFEKIGLDSVHVTTGIGSQFLGTILGADMLGKATRWFTGGQVVVEGVPNPVVSSMLRFGTYLGVFFTSIFLIVHAITAFFNKMEYGDILGEARERFIGGFRAVIAFGLIMPISASGISGASHGVAMVAAASNGIGNKAAQMLVEGGFGSDPNSLTSLAFTHTYNPDMVSRTFSESVGFESCRQYMLTTGANAVDVGRVCGAIISNDSTDLDVEYDPASATAADDSAYCEEVTEGGWFTDTRYAVRACQKVLAKQREARQQASAILEEYDGDLEHPDATEALMRVAENLHVEIRNEISELNSAVHGDYNASDSSADGGPAPVSYLHSGMKDLITQGGWPSLGLIYAQIGSQIDSINSIQGMGGVGGFSMEGFESAGAHSQSLLRIVGRNSAIADAGAALGDANGGGGGSSNWVNATIGWFSDMWGAGTDAIETGARAATGWLFSPIFTQPGPAATQEIGTTILGAAATIALAHDISLFIPGARVAVTGAKAFIESASGVLSNWSEGSILVKLLVIYVGLLIMLLLLVATFLVVILPKLPIFFVAFLALEWAIWCCILVFLSPLWVALNLTAVGNQPGLFTQRALGGLGVLAYLLLFPTMVVMAVVVSLIAYNLIIPILGMMLLLSYGGGGVASLIGAMTMPFMVLLSMSVGGFVAISAIMKVPPMISGFLGIQAPGDSVSQQASTFIASPMQYSNVTNPQTMINQGAAAVGRGRA